MKSRINPDMDIVAYVLAEVLKAKPDDNFSKSLQQQYAERGGLSRKQLEGLMGKAQRIGGIHSGRLATLEAIIKKKHVTHRSEATVVKTEEQRDDAAGEMIDSILSKYPQHKRVLLFRANFEKAGKLAVPEKEELMKFHKLLVTKS